MMDYDDIMSRDHSTPPNYLPGKTILMVSHSRWSIFILFEDRTTIDIRTNMDNDELDVRYGLIPYEPD